MEIRVIQRGILAGLTAGLLAFVFAYVYVEPLIEKAIEYEEARGHILAHLSEAAGLATDDDHGPEVFSRTIQSTLGLATGMIGMGIALGALVAVAFLILRPRVALSSRALGWSVAAFGFVGVFLLPFAKYPANPPAVGNDFTIRERGGLYLLTVALSLLLLGLAVLVAARLTPRLGRGRAIGVGALGLAVSYGIVMLALPSLGDLAGNVAAAGELGHTRAATETPQAIRNTLEVPLTVEGMTYAPGQIVFEGFDADLLWTFRWYAIVSQALIWSAIGLVFGGSVERLLRRSPAGSDQAPALEPTGSR